MEIALELSVFNTIKYYDEPHKYYMGKTQFIGKFKPAFDSEYWAKKKADERGIEKEEILKEWKYKSDFACEKGTLFHEYAENYLNNKIFPYPLEKVVKLLGNNDVQEPYDKIVKHFDEFYKDSFDKLLPIKSEIIVGDEELGICGMVDQLFWNKKTKEYQIWDWKTNKEIKRKNHWQKFKSPISHLDVCEMNTYSLQLSLYKYIIEKNTNLKLGDSYIVWFNEKNETYKPIKCYDFQKEIVKMLEKNG